MDILRADPSRPAWKSDEMDSPIPPTAEAPYFDQALNAWVLSRHKDVLAAFRRSALVVTGARSTALPGAQDAAMLRMRAETREALSPAQLRLWRNTLSPFVQTLAAALPEGSSVDILRAYVQPACLEAAALVTGIDPENAAALRKTSRVVSASAAEPFDSILRRRAKLANARLRKSFHSPCETLRDSGFVAVAHTMPHLLANAWYALLQSSPEWRLLHAQPDLVEQAVEELLRFAGLTRVLFRRAVEDVDLNGTSVRKGDRVVLRIIAANRDPARFQCPHQVNVKSYDGGQLALGAGLHACVGASLIRMIVVLLTRTLVEQFSELALSGPVRWKGGSGFRSPVALPVRLTRA